jgi:hypothetical protein
MVKGTCKICGKEEILNLKGECYDCCDLNSDNSGGDERKKVREREETEIRHRRRFADRLYFLMALIYNVGSIFMAIMCAYAIGDADRIVAMCGYVVLLLVEDCVRFSDWTDNRGFWWIEPIISFVVKTFTMCVPFFILDWIAFFYEFFLIYGIFHSNLKPLVEIVQDAETNNLYYEETEGLPDVGTIPETNIPEWAISEEIYKLALENAESCIDKLSVTEEQKSQIYDLVLCEDEELYMDNDINYLYCGVVVDLLENHLEKLEVSDYFPNIWKYKEIARSDRERTHVTKLIFEMSQRLQKEFVAPYDRYRNHIYTKKELIKDVNSDYAILMTGHVGEERVETALKPYEGQIITIPNLRIEVEGNSVESDFVIVSPYGVYVLEVKNLGNKSQYGLHIAKDGRWTKTYGGKKEVTKSPVEQNERHILYLEKYINQALGRGLDEHIRLQGMVVIANDNVDIQNETDDVIIRYGNIMNTIRKRPIIMKEAEMKVVAETLKSAGLAAKRHTLSYCKNPFEEVYLQLFAGEKQFMEWAENVKPLQQYVDDFIENRYISDR